MPKQDQATVTQKPTSALATAAPFVAGVGFWIVFLLRTITFANGTWYFSLFDDGMISMRYAQQLADGNGLVWNAGQAPVEGYTNFLWTMWMAVLHLTGLPDKYVAVAVSLSTIPILLAILFLVRRVAEQVRPGDRFVSLASLWLTVTFYPLAYWTLRGMEVGLVALILIGVTSLLLGDEDRPGSRAIALLVLLAVAGTLTRTDTAGFLILMGVVSLVWNRGRSRLLPVLTIVVPLVTVAAHSALRVRWYGQVMPNTYTLKIEGIALVDRFERGMLVAVVVAFGQVLIALALATYAAIVSFRTGERRHAAALLATPFVVGLGYTVWVGGDAWEHANYANRFLTPAFPMLFVLVAVGAATLRTRFSAQDQVRALRGSIAASIAIGFVFLADVIPTTGHLENKGGANQVRGATLLAVAAALAVVLVIIRSQSAAPARARSFATGLVLTTILMAGAWPYANWASNTGLDVQSDTQAAVLGTTLREALPAGTTIALTQAGNIVYYSGFTGIDILGKSDAVIARGPSHAFAPGHSKWDYNYSIGQLKPMIVLQLFYPTLEDRKLVESFGYTYLSAEVFYDATRVDPVALAQALAKAGWEDVAPN
jgi:hypothetical protein